MSIMSIRRNAGVPTVLACMIAGSAVAAGGLAAVERTLTPLRVELREGKSPVHRIVAVATQGEKVTVLEQDAKGWLHVQRAPALGGQKGYVHQRALDVKASKPGKGNLSEALEGRSDGPQVSAAAAAKGIQPQTQIYISSRGWNAEGLVELKRRREAVTIEEFEAFLAALKGGG